MTKLPRRVRAKKPVDIDAGKIAKLMRLMLSSDQPGEMMAAGAALRRTLAQAKLDLHDLADAVTIGLRPPAPAPRRSPGTPELDLTNWEAMAWFCHFHRFKLRGEDRERVADYLLGQAFRETDDRCTQWHLDELRRIVARVRAAIRSTSVQP